MKSYMKSLLNSLIQNKSGFSYQSFSAGNYSRIQTSKVKTNPFLAVSTLPALRLLLCSMTASARHRDPAAQPRPGRRQIFATKTDDDNERQLVHTLRFVVSRTSGAEYFQVSPFFSNGPANKRQAGPSCDGRFYAAVR